MHESRKKLNFKKAKFPISMTIISLILFVGVYWLVTYKSITPFYFEGLLFAIPFIVFGFLTYLTVQGYLKKMTSTIITGVFIVVFGIGSLHTLTILSFDAATIETNDVKKYERVLRLTDDSLTQYFPDQIPNNAENIDFIHQPRFIQGGEMFRLKYQTDSKSIQDYQNQFLKEAKRIGNIANIETEQGAVFDFGGMSNEFIIYIFVSEPSQPNDWNHGKYSLAAINEKSNEIIFLMENW